MHTTTVDLPDMPALSALQEQTGSTWLNIQKASEAATAMRKTLENCLDDSASRDTSVVAFGSLARGEFTNGSDVDWVLLVDGLSDPKHLDVAIEIGKKFEQLGVPPTGAEGIFSSMASSHDLIHYIGGQGDTNANTTRRMLLLLESVAITGGAAHKRVLRNILFRYLEEDRGLWYGSSPYKIPRFFLNDVARYWRTMAVDFAYKQRSRPGGDFALKNFKLRMSRKLIFLAGLIACFECHLGFDNDEERGEFYKRRQVQPVIELVERTLSKPPLEIVACALAREDLYSEGKRFFDAYDKFLGMLADPEIRNQLKAIPVKDLSGTLAAEYRDVAHDFMSAIREIFLVQTNRLGELTIEYGVF